MKIIYNSIGEDLIDLISKAEKSGRSIKEIQVSEVEARQLESELGYGWSIFSIKKRVNMFMGIPVKVSGRCDY